MQNPGGRRTVPCRGRRLDVSSNGVVLDEALYFVVGLFQHFHGRQRDRPEVSASELGWGGMTLPSGSSLFPW